MAWIPGQNLRHSRHVTPRRRVTGKPIDPGRSRAARSHRARPACFNAIAPCQVPHAHLTNRVIIQGFGMSVRIASRFMHDAGYKFGVRGYPHARLTQRRTASTAKCAGLVLRRSQPLRVFPVAGRKFPERNSFQAGEIVIPAAVAKPDYYRKRASPADTQSLRKAQTVRARLMADEIVRPQRHIRHPVHFPRHCRRRER